MYKSFIKGVLDFVLSLMGFSVLFPFFILLVVILGVVNKGNPFFFQKRPGKNLKPFNAIKFKTMKDAFGANGEQLPDDQRLTRLGKWVRATSLDEIPQLISVMKGDMSLVGPRPLFMEYVTLYSEEQKQRHEVKPGITGWAQVNGRNTISWKQKFEYDVWYVKNVSFGLDLKILLITLIKVFKAEGISGEGVATVEKFDGTN